MKHFFILFLTLSALLTAQEERRFTEADRLRWLEKWSQLNQEPQERRSLSTASYPLIPSAIQTLYSHGVAGDWLQLADGSEWKVKSSDHYLVAHWQAGEQLLITQADCLLCSSQYKLVNVTRGVAIHANRLSKPLNYLSSAKTVVAIDTYADRVYLSDGTYWDVTWIDDMVMSSWQLGDLIMIGVNGGYNRGSYPALLINVSVDVYDQGADSWVTARQLRP